MSVNSIYKVKEWIINQIREGELKHGTSLPSNLSIARTVNVKTDDVYDAINELIIEQIITDNVEEGASVKRLRPFFYPLGERISLNQMISEQGYVPGIEYLNLEEYPATSLDAEKLALNERDMITKIERLRMADRNPVVYCLDKIATDHLTCKDYQSANGSLLETLRTTSGIEIEYVDTEIEALSYEPHISQALEADLHEGLMLLEITHYDKNHNPIIYSLNYFKSSLVKFKTVKNRL